MYVSGNYYGGGENNKMKEVLLLRAMTKSDKPKEWRKLSGIHSMTALWKTLDKMSIRKEYHEALVRNGIDLDTIVDGIAEIARDGKESNRLRAWQTILRSIGLSEYKDAEMAGGVGWEDAMRNILEDKVKGEDARVLEGEVEAYDVVEPAIPEDEVGRLDDEKKMSEDLFK